MAIDEIKENKDNFIVDFFDIDVSILELFLQDMSSKKNLIWGTDNYIKHGKNSYDVNKHINIKLLKIKNKWIIEPRVYKNKLDQKKRSKEMAEVFTPSWVCNKQNNLVDNEWFGYEGMFNVENEDNTWISTNKVDFKNKDWKEYVDLERLEITCGEAPYLVSRYDTVDGRYIAVKDRIGLLDRKLRVISENTFTEEEWLEYAKIALERIYGFDYQGDNVLIARINVLKDVCDFYKEKFNKKLDIEKQKEFAKIIVWNIFQMDGLKFVVPLSCHEESFVQMNLFGDEVKPDFCQGCISNDISKHNGIYVMIRDWKKEKAEKFVDTLLRSGYYGR